MTALLTVCVCVRKRVYVDIAEATSTMQRMYGPIFLMCGCAMRSIL